MNDKHWYLQQVDLFKGIPDEEIMKIAQKIEEKKCAKKEVLYTPHENTNYICVLKKGEVTLYNSHRGKKIIIDVLKPGSIFGNITFQENEQNTHFAEVTEDAYICFFKPDDFLSVIRAKPELMIKFFRVISKRLTEYEKRIKSGLLDAKEKILHHLTILEEKNKSGILNRLFGNKGRITHEKLAEHTGLSRETVTRAITDLRKEGVIEITEDGKILAKHR